MIAPYHTHRRLLLGVADGTPLCSVCGKPHERQRQRLCRECHNAYQRRWSAARTRMAREYRETFHGKQTVTDETA